MANKITVGSNVVVNPRSDRTRIQRKEGIIKAILSGSLDHPHGVLVELEDGTIGRVKDIEGEKSNYVEIKNEIDYSKLTELDESDTLEFKSSALWSINCTLEQIKTGGPDLKYFDKECSKVIIARTIAAFLNSKGGDIIIGVQEENESKKIIGVESEYKKLRDHQNQDGYKRMIIDYIIHNYLPSKIFNHLSEYVNISFPKVEQKVLCHINVKPCDSKVFLSFKNKEMFYIRVDSESRELKGEALVDYCSKHFRKHSGS